MKLTLDRERCSGHGRCADKAPEVYDLDDAGYCLLLVDVVPPSLHQHAIDGADACPETALQITE